MYKCSCSRLRGTAWVFVGVEQESGRAVSHVSLIAPRTHRLLLLRRVSFPAPQSSVTVGTSNVILGREGLVHHAVEPCIILMDSLTCAHTNMIEATWKIFKVHLRLYLETKVKCVINVLKYSLSAGFDIVAELIVKHCVLFITTPLVHIFHLSCLTGYFPNT
jgi:hypothetical protein